MAFYLADKKRTVNIDKHMRRNEEKWREMESSIKDSRREKVKYRKNTERDPIENGCRLGVGSRQFPAGFCCRSSWKPMAKLEEKLKRSGFFQLEN